MLRQVSLCLTVMCLLLPCAAKINSSTPAPSISTVTGEKWAEEDSPQDVTEEKVGQLFMIWVRAQFLNVNSPDYLQLRDSITNITSAHWQ